MSGLNAFAGTFALPWWTLAATLLLVVILGVLAAVRSGWQKAIGSVTQLVAVFGVLLLAWSVFDRLNLRDVAEQRRSFQTRLAEVNAHALAPASPLACLDALVGDAVTEPCEKAIFANPESAAAAVSLMAARIALLREAVAHAGDDPIYDKAIADLRRGLEPDRFGFVAQALASSEQCKPDSCDALTLFRDPHRVNANLSDRTFEIFVGRYVGTWMSPRSPASAPAVAAAPAHQPTATATASAAIDKPAAVTPATSSVNVEFPSAASIPPVSIMTNEPGMAQGGTDAEKADKADKTDKAAASRRSTPVPTPRAASRSGNATPSTSAQ
jgi:hypothetical protein